MGRTIQSITVDYSGSNDGHRLSLEERTSAVNAERWSIKSAHPTKTRFTHFKTNSNIYRVLRCCVLMKKSKHSETHEMGYAK